ncbi:hypothetical protein E3T27_00205 [Cryobacterium lyxosi]|uniref:Helix-turn-helix domain-containing protein n=1 Tax=Cryobacterium lyxosi TaxID=1259228 RepID=A0A4R8ZL20_9MICO|nr:hypothetical protein E3T27_00205 [Cryobacterium lyxosi]
MVRRIEAKRVLELRAEGMTGRAIALSQGMSRKCVLAVFELPRAFRTAELEDSSTLPMLAADNRSGLH